MFDHLININNLKQQTYDLNNTIYKLNFSSTILQITNKFELLTHMQEVPPFKHLYHNLLGAFKTASSSISETAGKSMNETHHKILNKILLVSQKDLDQVIKEILTYFLTLAQAKNCSPIVIALLTKFIDFLKYYQKVLSSKYIKSISLNNEKQQTDKPTKPQQKPSLKKPIRNQLSDTTLPNPQQAVQEILQSVIDIICLIQTKSKSSDQQTHLRIIQTTFSLIDVQFIQYMSFNLLTKIYSISFDSCHVNTVIQNISVSCLFSLTETLFSLEKKQKQSHMVLENWLQFLFRSKKFLWIKDSELNGMVWDLIVAGVKNQPQGSLQRFCHKQSNVQLLNLMYKISAQKAFNTKGINDKQPQGKQNKKSNQNEVSMAFRHDPISQFIRCYKAFIILSTQYSLTCLQTSKQQIVPFRDNIRMFNIIYDLERNWRMYILLQVSSNLFVYSKEFPIHEEKGYMLLEIVSKIAEELCLGNQKIEVKWINEKSFLNKFYAGDLWTVNDGDFVKIIRNSLIGLRKKFEYMKNKDSDWWIRNNNNGEIDKSMSVDNVNSERSDQGPKSQNVSSARKRWEKFIRCIIKIIRYLSSISILSQTDQQPVRKIILQLQHWFLICPSTKIKNLILQQLLITTSTLTTKQQAIKISQCIQIGSNLIYGYYDMLDSIGLTIIMKMMAGIKASKEEGKEFQELEEVFNMSQKLYLEQKIVKTQKNFSTTIQAFVQCANSLVADLEQPPNPSRVPALGKNPSQRYYKMIEYLLQKLNIVILQNKEYLFDEWNFLTGFWMSFCSSKNNDIQCKTIVYVGEVVQKLLQLFKQRQQEIISIYVELSAKCTVRNDLKIQYHIIQQIKNYLPLLENQQALMETFKIVKILQTQVRTSHEQQKLKTQNPTQLAQSKKFMLELSELQQAFIKEGIHRIKKLSNLVLVIDGIQVLGSQKNEQYKILTLLWTVADHLRALSASYQSSQQPSKLQQYQQLWKQVFQKLQTISTVSINAETKQSSIHTFTQIIAESSPLIKDDILIELYEKIFVESLFLELLENHTRFKQVMGNVDISLKVQIIKAGVKNYLKLTKKFILESILKEPIKSIDFALQKIYSYLQALNKSDSKPSLPVQVLYEFLIFVQKLIDGSNIELKHVNKQMLAKILAQIELVGQGCDQTTILWRKKYMPHFTEVSTMFSGLLQSEEKTAINEESTELSIKENS